MSPPRISIVTVVYNGVQEIEKTILSVIQQSYANLEYIVIDGGSNDGTVEIIKKYSKQITYWHSVPDGGIYDAMNKGTAVATGEWINFMNCGDRFATNEILKIFAQADYDADIVHGEAIIVYPTFETSYPTLPLKSMWKAMPFCHQAAFVKRALISASPFDVALRLSADYDFLFKAYLGGKKFQAIDLLICYFDYRAGASRKNSVRSVEERMQTVLKRDYSLSKSIYYALFRRYVIISLWAKAWLPYSLKEWITEMLKKLGK